MNNYLLSVLLFGAIALPSAAETVTLEGKDYEVEVKTDRMIGPGVRHQRFRLPSYPLNINVLTVDLNNPYNRIETTTANESSKGTELLVKAAQRQSSEGHRALAGANANFWVVGTQREEYVYSGITRNASIRNGKMVTESNQHRDQWDGGTMRTGVVSLSYDKTAYIDYCTSAITVTSDKIGTMNVHQCNKGVHDNELCMYNSFYGASREFMPIIEKPNGSKGNWYYLADGGDATEVLLDLEEGQGWDSGRDIVLTVKEVRLDAGKGTLGSHDLALVGRGENRTKIAALAPGDKVTLKYTWTYNPGTDKEVTPLVEQAVGGNALVMRDGQLTDHNYNEAYNSQVYSRTGYGCSADGKTLYIIVIDKANSAVYGSSNGCNTAKMCEFARWLGCSNMANFDAGGSAEMLVYGKIENNTTEGTPRAVANGWLIYSTAPEDTPEAKDVASICFFNDALSVPLYGQTSPQVIAYNKYGAVLDYDYKDFTLSCDSSLGSCEGNGFTAGGTAAKGKLKATVGSVTAEMDIEVIASQPTIRIKPLLIDGTRSYPIEVSASVDGNNYSYDPANLQWTVDDTSIAQIDATGVLRGIAEGSTTFTGKIGDINESAEVNVEIAPAAEMSVNDWSEATVKGSGGLSNAAITADGTINYKYGSARGAYLQLTRPTRFYSLPDKVLIEFTPDIELLYVDCGIRYGQSKSITPVRISPEGEGNFAAGTKHLLEIPVEGLADLANYPVTLEYVRFYAKASSEYKGERSMQVGRFVARYNNYNAAVETIESSAAKALKLTPNPVEAGASFSVSGNEIRTVEIYNAAGALIRTVDGGNAPTLTLQAPDTKGSYIIRAITADGASATVLVVG